MTRTEIRPRPFVCRVAAGKESHALSGVWRIWAARNKPELYLAARDVGQIKATVHCPRPGRATWKRHFGFTSDAQGRVADAVRASGQERHQATWPGAKLAPDLSLEWRIFVLGTALRKQPLPVSGDVIL